MVLKRRKRLPLIILSLALGIAAEELLLLLAEIFQQAGETVVLRRSTPLTQGVDLIENDPLPADTLEDAFDKLTSIAQELQEQADRSIKISRTNTMTSTEFTPLLLIVQIKFYLLIAQVRLSVAQELGTFKGTDATVTTAAYSSERYY